MQYLQNALLTSDSSFSILRYGNVQQIFSVGNGHPFLQATRIDVSRFELATDLQYVLLAPLLDFLLDGSWDDIRLKTYVERIMFLIG